MNKFLASLSLALVLSSCSNTPDMETGEIKTLQMLKTAFVDTKKTTQVINARNLLTREQIDAANMPVLFVELSTGKNGTLTPYPGQGIGQTWLGADGATITTEQGVLKASRGMGDDLMGSFSSMPKWSKIEQNTNDYARTYQYLNGNNQISISIFNCKIRKNKTREAIKIWEIKFHVTKFEETCDQNNLTIKNTYYIDDRKIVRKSQQYHGSTIGYLITERLDR